MKEQIFIALLLISLSVQCASSNKCMKNKGNKLVEQIEQYRSEHGSLPSSLTDMGLLETESGPLYYDRMDSTNYVVSFSYSVGESINYYSTTGQWDDD